MNTVPSPFKIRRAPEMPALLAGWLGAHLGQPRNRAFLLSQGSRVTQVWPGGLGQGEGPLRPSPCSPSGPLPAGPWECGGAQVRLTGHPLHHRGPSSSWDNWAVIPEGPRGGTPRAPVPGVASRRALLTSTPNLEHVVACGPAAPACTCQARPSQARWSGLCSASPGDTRAPHAPGMAVLRMQAVMRALEQRGEPSSGRGQNLVSLQSGDPESGFGRKQGGRGGQWFGRRCPCAWNDPHGTGGC